MSHDQIGLTLLLFVLSFAFAACAQLTTPTKSTGGASIFVWCFVASAATGALAIISVFLFLTAR